jgi:predicted Zn-dependent peptidase
MALSQGSAGSGGEWRQVRLGPRLRLWQTSGEKFKTCTLRIYLHAPLQASTVTTTALVPYVLGRGCQGYPDLTAIQRRLEELYGAAVGAGVTKIGELQSLYLGLDVVRDRYVAADVLPGAVDLLARMLLQPVLDDDGCFPARVVAQEKDQLARRLAGLINDKMRYAALRCVEEMCRGEPYALLALGRREDLPAIGPADVTARWRQLLATAPVDVFAVGGGEGLVDLLGEALAPLCAGGAADVPQTRPGPAPAQPRRVAETEDVEQGQLCLGYRTAVTRTDPRYPAMLVCSGLLGGFPHSRLFRHVREKAGLAYAASAQWDAFKGVLLVQAGIDPARYAQALAIIEEQLADLAAGRIGEEELEWTRRGWVQQLRAAQDSPYALLDAAVGDVLAGDLRPLDARLAEIRAVTRTEVAAAAEGVRLDTIYLLADHDPLATAPAGGFGPPEAAAARSGRGGEGAPA